MRLWWLFLLLSACALFEPQSKVRSGALFQTGQAQYDDYFNKVHELQLEVAGFDDQKKADRRGLIDALKIATDSVDVTLLEATHQRIMAASHVVGAIRLELREDDGKLIVPGESRADLPTRDFIKALQATLDGELKRKRSLRDIPQRCDDLAKTGRELEPRVHDDFFKQGGTMMADVHDELDASFDVLKQISDKARLAKRETEDFISDLGRAVIADPGEYHGGSSGEAVATVTKPIATSHPTPVATVATTTTTAPVVKPKPKPKPQSGGGDEDFNP